jgi:glycosyltransferase involved in cell wall biosynthesis
MPPNVAIVLAAYNGALHLEEQLASLRAQDVQGWRLYARDDGSSDGTPELLARAAREDARITVLEGRENLGVIRNFGVLLEHARREGADLVFLSDQDDVWLPTKLSRSLEAMRELERAHGPEVPLLVHTDLRVVDESLRTIHESFLAYAAIRHEKEHPLGVLVAQNFVTGCTTVVNRHLLDVALPLPTECIMHDWWMAECAAALGHIGFVEEPTILYRQHGANQLGAVDVLGSFNVFRASGRTRVARRWRTAVRTLGQARALGARLRERGRGSDEVRALVDAYAHIGHARPLERIRILRHHGIRRQGSLLNLLLYVRLAMIRR